MIGCLFDGKGEPFLRIEEIRKRFFISRLVFLENPVVGSRIVVSEGEAAPLRLHDVAALELGGCSTVAEGGTRSGFGAAEAALLDDGLTLGE